MLYRLFPHYLGTFEVVTHVGTLKQEASTVYKDWRIASYRIENCHINRETKDERYQEVRRRLREGRTVVGRSVVDRHRRPGPTTTRVDFGWMGDCSTDLHGVSIPKLLDM